MAETEQQLQEDLALRNAAKRLVKSGVENVKSDFAGRSLGSRVAQRVKDGSADMAEDVGEFASEHRWQLGTGLLVGAVACVGWMFRDQLADAVYNLVHRNDGPVEKLAREAEAKAEQLGEDVRSLVD